MRWRLWDIAHLWYKQLPANYNHIGHQAVIFQASPVHSFEDNGSQTKLALHPSHPDVR